MMSPNQTVTSSPVRERPAEYMKALEMITADSKHRSNYVHGSTHCPTSVAAAPSQPATSAPS
eukprot:8943820-Ditylum_brightwellii.AAC.2